MRYWRSRLRDSNSCRGCAWHCCADFFELPPAKLCEHIRALLEAPAVVERKHRRTHEPLLISLNPQLLIEWEARELLEEWKQHYCPSQGDDAALAAPTSPQPADEAPPVQQRVQGTQ